MGLRHRQVEHLVDVGQPSVGTGRDVGPDPLREQCTGQDSGFRRLQPPGPPERVLGQFGPILDRVGQQQRHRQLPFDLAQQHDAPMLPVAAWLDQASRISPSYAARSRSICSDRSGEAPRPLRPTRASVASASSKGRWWSRRDLGRTGEHWRHHRNGVGGAEPVRGRSWRVLWRCRCRRWQASGRTAPRPGPMLPPPARRGPWPTQIRRQPRVDRARVAGVMGEHLVGARCRRHPREGVADGSVQAHPVQGLEVVVHGIAVMAWENCTDPGESVSVRRPRRSDPRLRRARRCRADNVRGARCRPGARSPRRWRGRHEGRGAGPGCAAGSSRGPLVAHRLSPFRRSRGWHPG